MRIIYIDSLFLINLLADYTLLLAAARVSGAAVKRRRCLLSAIFGAGCAALSFVRGFYFLSAAPCRLALAGIMGLIAFGGEAQLLRCIAVFLAVSASFGGAVAALGVQRISLGVLALCFLFCYAGLTLISLCRAKLPARKTADVSLCFLGRDCRLRALIDSGNCLTDPLSGADVMIVRAEALRPVFGASAGLLELRDPVEFISAASALPQLRGRFRLLPFSSLGGKGILPVFRPECVTVNGREQPSLLCAVSPEAGGDGFDAIIGL